MKTIDEVINALEICGHDEFPKCPYFDKEHWRCCEDHMRSIYPLKTDALHYLKEYHEHLKWQAYEEHCLAEEKKKIKQAYEQGYAQAKHDDEVSRSWEESYRQSQMPWNHYTEMGG